MTQFWVATFWLRATYKPAMLSSRKSHWWWGPSGLFRSENRRCPLCPVWVVIHPVALVVSAAPSKLYNLESSQKRSHNNTNNSIPTLRCQWPCCSPHCEDIENPNSHGIDCEILRLGPGPKTTSDIKAMTDYYRPDALLVLKCLLLQKQNPKKWKKLMKMQSHEEDREGSELQEYVLLKT